MKKINPNIKYLSLVLILLIFAIFFTYGKHGNFLVDVGREVYYPQEILNGKVLYKDLFNVYGPFSYLFNACLYKLFGMNLNVLYLAGCICAGLITIMIYLISDVFLPRQLSFAISLFTIIVGVLSVDSFNFIFPYSYAILYGITSFLISIFCLLQYNKHPQKNIYLYLSSFFIGLSIASKYEFILLVFVLLYAALKIKKLETKQLLFAALNLFAVPLLSFAVLFCQGLNLNDLVINANILKKMAHSQTLKYLYQNMGVFFHPQTIPFLIFQFIKTTIPLVFLYLAFKQTNKLISSLLIIATIVLSIITIGKPSFVFLPILATILFALNFKTIYKNTGLFILLTSCILISLKIFWGCLLSGYGVFFISLLIVSICAVLINKNEQLEKPLSRFIILCSILLLIPNIQQLHTKNNLIKSTRGNFYTDSNHFIATDSLIKYINSNTKLTDEIAIFPEGLFLNFITQRKSDGYYNSLIPLHIETFGEEKIINHFAETKPEYIIFTNGGSKDYYFKTICNDYALEFCKFVSNTYTPVKIIDNDLRYLIFKRTY